MIGCGECFLPIANTTNAIAVSISIANTIIYPQVSLETRHGNRACVHPPVGFRAEGLRKIDNLTDYF